MQSDNRVECAADMYENGNKIGIMGYTQICTQAKSNQLKTDRFLKSNYFSCSMDKYKSNRSLIYPANSFSIADKSCFT